MIRQLERLIRPLRDRPGCLAVAVYAEPAAGGGWRLVPAVDQGFEGVACVDDASRAAILFLRLGRAGGGEPARRVARGLLAFVASMQRDDGRFLNFVVDWEGTHNDDGPTSRPGGPWSARAAHALACGARELDDPALAAAAERALEALAPRDPHLDVGAVTLLAALELWEATDSSSALGMVLRLSEEIAGATVDGVLCDDLGTSEVHLWGHLQEAALARAGVLLERGDLVEAARRSAVTLLVPVAEAGFPARRVQPFEVSSTAMGLDAVARATGDGRLWRAAVHARQWFHGRNAACRPVYDPRTGAIHDGIDDGRVSVNSGAESNVEGALVLLAPGWAGPQPSCETPRRRARVPLTRP